MVGETDAQTLGRVGWIKRGVDLPDTVVVRIRAEWIGGDRTPRLQLIGELAAEAERCLAPPAAEEACAALEPEEGTALAIRVLDVVVALCAPED